MGVDKDRGRRRMYDMFLYCQIGKGSEGERASGYIRNETRLQDRRYCMRNGPITGSCSGTCLIADDLILVLVLVDGIEGQVKLVEGSDNEI